MSNGGRLAPTDYGEDDFLDLMMARRLRGLARDNPSLSAGLSFDLASGLDDDVADTLAETGMPRFHRPNAFGQFLRLATAREAPRTPVKDLKAFQERLKEQGYLPPDYTPDGVWDPRSPFASAVYRYGDDQGEAFRHGNGKPTALSTNKAIQLLDATLPSRIFQGLGGMVKDMGRSFASTLERFGSLAVDWDDTEENLADIKKHLGEDAINTLSVISLFVGIGEVIHAGRLLQGFGAAAPNVLARFGVREGASILAKPADDVLLARGTGLSVKAAASIMRRFGGHESADNVVNWVARYGLRAQQARPVSRIAGQFYSGFAKATFFPNVAGIMLPESELGEAVRESPRLPWWTDLAVLAVAPEAGLLPRYRDIKKVLRVRDFGPLDPFRQLRMEVPDDLTRSAVNVQAYQRHLAADRLTSRPDWPELRKKGGTFVTTAEQKELTGVAREALIDPNSPERGLTQEFFDRAQEWALVNDKSVANFLYNLHSKARIRVERGDIGFNPEENYRAAERMANEVTDYIRVTKHQASALVGGASATTPDEIMAARFPDIKNKRVVPMRMDNPATKQEVETLITDLVAAGEVTPPIRAKLAALGLGRVPDRNVMDHLDMLSKVAPEDVTSLLPAPYAEEFRANGYKAVLRGAEAILRSDVSPLVTAAPKFSNKGYLWASFGMSPRKIENAAIARLGHSTARDAVEDFLIANAPDTFGPGSGEEVLGALSMRIRDREVELAKTLVESGPIARAGARMQMQNLRGVNDASVPFIKQTLMDNFGALLDNRTATMLARGVHKSILTSFAHPGAVESPSEMLSVLDKMGAALRVHGLPGIVESLRAMTVSDIKKIGVGKIRLGKVPGFSSIPDNWGFLPEKLLRATLSLRFTMNPLFEAQQLVESQVIRITQDLSPVTRPLRRMNAEGTLPEATSIFQRVHGQAVLSLDDAERALLRANIFGYNLQNHAMYDYFRIYKREVARSTARGLSPADADVKAIQFLKENGWKTFSYGPRAPLEKSVNMVFFPFSFQKKMVGLATEYFTAQPVRTLLLHETAKRVQALEEIKDEQGRSKLRQILLRYAPLYDQLSKFNAFSYGIGLGDFGGVYKYLAQTLALPVTVVQGALHPVGVTGENIPQFKKLLPRLIPAIRQVTDFYNDAKAQSELARPLPPGEARQTVESQIDDFQTLFHARQAHYAKMAQSFGALPNIESFMRSSRVPDFLKAQWLEEQAALAERYPAGAQHRVASAGKAQAQTFNVDRILRKVHKTRAEQGVVALEALGVQLQSLPMFQNTDDPIAKIMRAQIETNAMRNEGLRLYKLLGDDFNDLWQAMGYAYHYGPISVEDIGKTA